MTPPSQWSCEKNEIVEPVGAQRAVEVQVVRRRDIEFDAADFGRPDLDGTDLDRVIEEQALETEFGVNTCVASRIVCGYFRRDQTPESSGIEQDVPWLVVDQDLNDRAEIFIGQYWRLDQPFQCAVFRECRLCTSGHDGEYRDRGASESAQRPAHSLMLPTALPPPQSTLCVGTFATVILRNPAASKRYLPKFLAISASLFSAAAISFSPPALSPIRCFASPRP
jgi:hypothetical protein